jgi:hypothetical protein
MYSASLYLIFNLISNNLPALPFYASFSVSEVPLLYITSDNRVCTEFYSGIRQEEGPLPANCLVQCLPIDLEKIVLGAWCASFCMDFGLPIRGD